MAIIPIGNQLSNSNGLPLDARTVIEGSMSEEYNNLPDCYEGMLIYSEYDSKIYLVTKVDDNKYIQSYIPIYDSTLDKLIFSDIDNNHIITISKGKIVISNSYLGSEYTITIEKDIELSVDGTIHKLSNKIDDVPTDDKKYIRIKGQWIEASNDIDIDDFSRKIYITQDATCAYIKYAVDPMHPENDIELFRIESVDAEIDNIAGLMYPEDKIKLNTLSQKVEELEQNQTTIDDVKEAMESLPDGSAVSAQVALNTAEVGKMQILDNTNYDWAIGDANGNVLIACKNGHIFTEKFNSSVVNKTIVDLQKNNTVVADTIDFSEETDWISTARNYILKGDNTTLQISDDLGKTWKSSTNPVGQIVFVHWFSNGTCLICSPTKAYYTINHTDWIQSDIKDADGNTITISDSQWCFNMMNSYNSPVAMIEDKEFCMWGDYGHSGGYTARIWCSDDYGATVKCVLKNGYSMTTHADGEKMLNITHFHHCMWDNIHKCYWITTGDYTTGNQLIKGTYEGNAWKFETVLKGDNAKFIMVWADDIYLYALTDYTTGIQTGLLRCPLNRISDINNWKFIWSPENNECLGNMFADAEGNMVITGDDATWKKFWYAHGDVDFKAINNTSNLINESNSPANLSNQGKQAGDFCIHYLVGPNYNGDVIASLTTYGWTATKAQCGWNVSKRVLFSKAMRNAGAKNFGKQKMF